MERWEKELADIRAILARRQEESDKHYAKLRKESRKEHVEFMASMKELRETLSGMGVSNGMVAEGVVYNSLKKSMTFGGVTFDRVSHSVEESITLPGGKRVEGEFDVVLSNCTSVAIIEVKYRVRAEDIDYLVDVQMPKFKVVLPQYKDCKVYLGIGGMAFEKGVKQCALRRGIGVLELSDNLVKEVRDKNVKAW